MEYEHEFGVSNFASCEIDENRESDYANQGEYFNAPNKNAGKSFKCNECNKSFCHVRNLIKHKNAVHYGIRPYECDLCSKSFTRFHTLTEHMRVHSGEKPFSCDQCPKSFAQNSTLLVHKKGVHQGVRPFECQQCDRSFVSAGELKRHSITHTGIAEY